MKKQHDWYYEWNRYAVIDRTKEDIRLFKEWIYPNKLEDFKNKIVLDCGCGDGLHINYIADTAKKIVGVDLNTKKIAERNTKKHSNVKIIEADLMKMNLHKKFDIVYSIGVVHHTVNPKKTFENIKKHLKKNGRMIIWVYSYEGNFLNRTLLEFFKRKIFLKLNKNTLYFIGNIITGIVYIPVYTIYLLPLRFLPFYKYFENWRKLSFKRNFINVFDKLNAPITHFIKREELEEWFNEKEFKNVHMSQYLGVNWRASGTKM